MKLIEFEDLLKDKSIVDLDKVISVQRNICYGDMWQIVFQFEFDQSISWFTGKLVDTDRIYDSVLKQWDKQITAIK